MSRTSRDDAVARIRKLMAMARDGSASEGEVENAMRMARQLMDRFAVEDHELDGEASSRKDAFVEEPGDWHSHEPTDRDRLLAITCANVCDVGAGTKTKVLVGKVLYCITFWGMPRDVAVAHALMRTLRQTMCRMARFRFGESWGTEHTSYCVGFAMQLATRSEELASESEQAVGAIILHKRAQLDAWAEERGGGTAKPMKRRPDLDRSAFAVGARDGAGVSLDKRGIGADRRQSPALLETTKEAQHV